jgi:DNA-binding NarL/FixJ family response regulator
LIRLVLADDHPLVLDGLEQLFSDSAEFAVVARCSDGDEALAALRRHRPDVVILDLRMPGPDGLAVVRAMRSEGLAAGVVLLTAALDDAEVVAAVRLGVQGIVLKEMASAVLVHAVREVHGGRAWLDPGATRRALGSLLQRDSGERGEPPALTPREAEIVRLVAAGLRNKEIARRLAITEGTVKIHLHNVFEKLNVGSRTELTVYARDKGMA